MKEAFDSYLTIFMHPFRCYDFFIDEMPLPGRELSPIRKISLTESLTISWFIVIIRSFLDLGLLYLAYEGVKLYQNSNPNILSLFNINASFSGYYFLLIKLILETLLFPILTYFWTLFWQYVIKLSGAYLDVEDIDEKSHLIMTNTLTSNLVRIIPIFGDIAYSLLSSVFLYAGIKKNFGLNSRSTLLLLSLPFLIFSFAVLFFFVALTLILI